MQKITAHLTWAKPALPGTGCQVLCPRRGRIWQQTLRAAQSPVRSFNWCQILADGLKFISIVSARPFSLQCHGGCFHLKHGSFCYCLTQFFVLLHFSTLKYIGPSLLKHRGNPAFYPSCWLSSYTQRICFAKAARTARKFGVEVLEALPRSEDHKSSLEW